MFNKCETVVLHGNYTKHFCMVAALLDTLSLWPNSQTLSWTQGSARQQRQWSRLAGRVWNNSMLTINSKMKVCKACVLSTLLYGSETWILYFPKNTDLMPSTCVVLDGSWTSPGMIVSQTKTFWHQQKYSICLPCSPRDACAGLVMWAAWKNFCKTSKLLKFM